VINTMQFTRWCMNGSILTLILLGGRQLSSRHSMLGKSNEHLVERLLSEFVSNVNNLWSLKVKHR
jgi:hypothetical protein